MLSALGMSPSTITTDCPASPPSAAVYMTSSLMVYRLCPYALFILVCWVFDMGVGENFVCTIFNVSLTTLFALVKVRKDVNI